MKIWKEKAGVISPIEVWCAYHSGYLYIEDTLPRLIWLMITEWNNDRHLS